MKYLLPLILFFALVSCNTEVKENQNEPTINIAQELEKIDQMRKSFEKTVKERRYEDLGQFVTKDMISIGPGSEDWKAYRALKEKHGNKFRYDSIKMNPKETVIVSDTVAYDFGVSSMFYTDETGTVHELKDTFLVLLKKNKEGEWKLFRELASANVE